MTNRTAPADLPAYTAGEFTPSTLVIALDVVQGLLAQARRKVLEDAAGVIESDHFATRQQSAQLLRSMATKL